MLRVVAFAGESGELGETPGALIGNPNGQLAVNRAEAKMGGADRGAHRSGRVHLAPDGYRGADLS